MYGVSSHYCLYFELTKHSQKNFDGQVRIMTKLATVNEHHRAMAMSSNTRNMGLQPVTASHCLWVSDDMGDVSFSLVHTIDYYA